MKRKTIFIIAFIALTLIILPLIAWAAQEQTVIVSSDEVINDNFVRFADKVIIDGQISGDIILVGGTIEINGTVSGDALIAAGSVTVNGNVVGNLRAVSSQLTIRGTVGKNVTVLANDLTLSKDGSVGWSLGYVVGSALINGPVYGNVTGWSLSTELNSTIGSNAKIEVYEDDLTVNDEAEIKGDFTYTSSQEIEVAEGQVGGVVNRLTPKERISDLQKLFTGSVVFFKVAGLFSLLLVGLVIITLFPKKTGRIVQDMSERPMAKIGWGIVFLIGIPMVIIILMVSVIGISLAMIIGVLYLILLYLSRIYLGILMGQKILGLFIKNKTISPIFPLILGVIIIYLLCLLPYLGWLVGLIATVWVLGSVIRIGYQDVRVTNTSEPTKKK